MHLHVGPGGATTARSFLRTRSLQYPDLRRAVAGEWKNADGAPAGSDAAPGARNVSHPVLL